MFRNGLGIEIAAQIAPLPGAENWQLFAANR